MNPAILDAIDEAFTLLPPKMNTRPARVEMLAIGNQESGFLHRRQLVGNPPRPVGPAKGFWQFERGGGCVGVLTHPASQALMISLCMQRGVKPTALALWDAIENDDVLAAGAARLLLYTDPRPLPAVHDAGGAWGYYVDNWRPGKPHKAKWPEMHAIAVRQEALRWGNR